MTGKVAREFENFMATIQDLATESSEFASKPSWIEFAPNNLCNLRCVMCPQADEVPVVAMQRADVRRVLDRVLPDASLWTPMATSEPLLNDIRVIVEQSREHDVLLDLHTNATLLTPERLRTMVDRLFRLTISFDSHEKDVFEAIRIRGDHGKTTANIEAAIPIAEEHGIPITFVAVFMADNADGLAGFVDYLADHGAAEAGAVVRVHQMQDYSKSCTGRFPTDRYTMRELESFVDAACERARSRNLSFYTALEPPLRRVVHGNPSAPRLVMPDLMMQLVVRIRREFPSFCTMATHYMKIEPNGDVFPCCEAPTELRMGNTHERSIEEIWNGPEYQAFRSRMFAADYPEPCRNCHVRIGDSVERAEHSEGAAE